jgi:hypothetical protein
MTKNNLKLLDMDEHLRKTHENRFKGLLAVCKIYNLTLDLATSDNVVYIEDEFGGSICIG